jgi:hypothetical protein
MKGKFSEKYSLTYPSADGLKKYICAAINANLRALIFFLFLFLASSCFEQGDCLITNTTIAKIKLKSLKTKADTTFTFASIQAVGGLELYKAKALSALELPVNPSSNQTMFILVQASRKDTLTLAYRNELIVIAPDCGAFDFQKDLSISKNTMGRDSVRILNSQLVKSATVNAEIYF